MNFGWCLNQPVRVFYVRTRKSRHALHLQAHCYGSTVVRLHLRLSLWLEVRARLRTRDFVRSLGRLGIPKLKGTVFFLSLLGACRRWKDAARIEGGMHLRTQRTPTNCCSCCWSSRRLLNWFDISRRLSCSVSNSTSVCKVLVRHKFLLRESWSLRLCFEEETNCLHNFFLPLGPLQGLAKSLNHRYLVCCIISRCS